MSKTPVKNKLPSLEILEDRLDYDSFTGVFKWKKNMLNNKIKKGTIAGCKKKSNDVFYLYIGIDGTQYAANRLAYYMIHKVDPYPLDVHHKDFNTLNNSITNLELLSGADNSSYKQLYINNTSGISGVRVTSEGRHRATGYHRGKEFNLGTFKTESEAIQSKKEFDDKKRHS